MIEIGWNIYYGVALFDEHLENHLSTDDEELKGEMNTLRDIEDDLPKETERFPVWKYPTQKLLFEEFGEECIALANPEKLEPHVKGFSDEIKQFVHSSRQKYPASRHSGETE